MKEFGYEEGKNIRRDRRNLPDEDTARRIATEFVRDRVDVIVAFENQTVRAAKAATSELPVDGMVVSLAHPGGNLTGVADSDYELEAAVSI